MSATIAATARNADTYFVIVYGIVCARCLRDAGSDAATERCKCAAPELIAPEVTWGRA